MMLRRFSTFLPTTKNKTCLLIIAVCLITLGGCRKTPPKPDHTGAQVRVISTPVEPVTHSKEYVVRTLAVKSVNLEARVQGYLAKRTFREGARVKKGQLLFEIEADKYQVAVDKAKAQLAKDQAKALESERNFERGKNLLAKRLISQEAYDSLLSDTQQSKASVKVSLSELEQAELELSYTRITAPFDGMIGMANYDTGSLVGSGGSTPLAQITSVDPIHVSYQVNEQALLALFPNQSFNELKKRLNFTLIMPDGSSYPEKGTLDFISPVINTDTDTITFRVSFPNPDNLLHPGMYATIRVEDTRKSMLPVIPQIAIQQGRQGAFVYVVKKGVASAVNISLDDMTVANGQPVLKGLEKGDSVIVEGFMNIQDGSKVKVIKQVSSNNRTPTPHQGTDGKSGTKPEKAG